MTFKEKRYLRKNGFKVYRDVENHEVHFNVYYDDIFVGRDNLEDVRKGFYDLITVRIQSRHAWWC